jgi:DNA-binding XRE family transcriptional regulator
MESIKNELLEIKKRKALSIDDMAQFIGIGRNTLGRILRNDNYQTSEAVSRKVRKYILNNKHDDSGFNGVDSEIEQHNNVLGVSLLDSQIASVNEQFQTHTVVDNSVHKHLQKQIDEMRKNNNIKSGVNIALEIIVVFLIVIMIIVTMTYGGLHV